MKKTNDKIFDTDADLANERLRLSIFRRIHFILEFVVPSAPEFYDNYLAMLLNLIESFKVEISDEQKEALSKSLQAKLQQGYEASIHSDLLIRITGSKLKVNVNLEAVNFVNHAHQLTYPRGQIQAPCLPSASGMMAQLTEDVLLKLQKDFTPEERKHLAGIFEQSAESVFKESAHSSIIINFTPPGNGIGIAYNVVPYIESVASYYNSQIQLRGHSLFGAEADRKVIAVLKDHCKPKNGPVLDVGAGPGRNSLPIAEMGYQVDAIDLTDGFVDALKEKADKTDVQITTAIGNVLDDNFAPPNKQYQCIVMSEVTSHFRSNEDLANCLKRLTALLAPNGVIVMNMFNPVEGYQPTVMSNEVADMALAYFFDNEFVSDLLEELPLSVVSTENVADYEKKHLPEESWPPINWYESWTGGFDIYAPLENSNYPPVNMNWWLLKKDKS